MSKILVPEAPVVIGSSQQSDEARVAAPSPLDAAFIGRIYRSMAWFGATLIVLIALGLKQIPATTSFAGGVLLAALLLRAHEVGVRALMRPKEQLGGFDSRLILVFLLPLKFALMAAALWAMNHFGLIEAPFLALGFFAGQLVIVAKVAGWMLNRAVKK